MKDRCPYYFHTMTNATPRRCAYEEGHIGDHKEEQLTNSQDFRYPPTGWIKHG